MSYYSGLQCCFFSAQHLCHLIMLRLSWLTIMSLLNLERAKAVLLLVVYSIIVSDLEFTDH